MALIYDTSAQSAGVPISVSRMNATKAFLRHFENKLILSFFAEKGSQIEKWQAEKELLICERKLRFWEKHPNFEGAVAMKEMGNLKKAWKEKGAH